MKSIRQQAATIFSVIWLASGSLSAQSVPSLTGNWKDEQNPDKQIEMYQQTGSIYSGKVINDKAKPSKNGFVVFRNLSWDAASRTYKGTLLTPDNTGEFTITVNLEGNDRFSFKVKKFFITKTFHFVRIKA